MEPVAGRMAQLRGELEIVVRAYRTDVTKVGGQMGQFGLNVQALGIPALQSVNGEAVPEVVESGRMAVRIYNLGTDT
jgi:hypothetical protein